jgi:superfamily I DNA/RNA helicase
MDKFSPNGEQQNLIDTHEGIYKVDAGAGTGKTYTVTLRYAEILQEKDVSPDDLLLLTFTNNAADEMKERIISECDYDSRELRDAPISTFHSLAKKMVNENGFDIPEMIGIDDSIASSTRLIEDEVLEKQEFRNFINRFISENPEYNNFYRVLYDYSELLGLIKSLAAKGIVPEEDGWYRGTEQLLDSDFEQYWEKVKELNETDGNKSSELRSRTGGIFNKCLERDAPSGTDVRGQPYVDKQIEIEYAEEAFKEDRQDLKQFIHDIYYEYVKYSLSKNFLNFNFLLVFAYILLCEKDSVRNRLKYKYTMVDEFQDTNEIQLKIAMLLSKGNIAVVGDWKQSIFSFQYAEVENIQNFEKRLKKYKKQLNSDEKRIDYSVDLVEEINLKQNYRSTQEILDFSEKSLTLPGKEDETIHEEKVLKQVTSLQSNKDENSSIEAFQSDEEAEAVLHKIQEVVDNEEYSSGGEKLDYGDIAVLTRSRSFGLDLQEKAREYSIPVAFEGGVELFTTRPSILLLAWLRVLDHKKSKKGWTVILDETGYNMEEIRHIIENQDYPENMVEFRETLEDEDYISGISRKVFERYGIENGFSDKITEVLQDTFDSSYKNTGNLIRFIEESIEEGATHEVDNSSKQDAVTVQTIHSAKGLEYPAVFIADINQDRFPSTSSNSSRITFNELTGLRQKKIYNPDRGFLFDNWKAHLTSKVQDKSYDEERRLLYVAMTRAENHVFLSATEERPSKFFENLNLEKNMIDTELEEVELEETRYQELEVDKPKRKAAIKKSPHDEMDLEEDTIGRGKEFGNQVHEFAEKYAEGEDVEPRNEDEENVKELIDSLDGELRTEVPIKIPEESGDRKILYRGKIDLLHITEDKVEIIDWKTDLTKENHEEYQRQLEVYKKGVTRAFDRQVKKKIIYTEE